jgi:nucleoside triphosphate diphosphatase
MTPSRDIGRLIEIMAALRHKETGCPWDIEQDFTSIAPYTIEEAYEVAEAIANRDLDELQIELGDLLLQVVYHARMAEELGKFAFPDVVEAITTKLIRRHPHVFGDAEARAAGAAKGFWEAAKAAERSQSGGESASVLSDIPVALPAVARATKLQAKAATVGFDWNDPRAVLSKLREEIDELESELDQPLASADRLQDEVGDLMFAVVNLARHLSVDADQALRRANVKFISRFNYIEQELAANGRHPRDATLDEMEALWQDAKLRES